MGNNQPSIIKIFIIIIIINIIMNHHLAWYNLIFFVIFSPLKHHFTTPFSLGHHTTLSFSTSAMPSWFRSLKLDRTRGTLTSDAAMQLESGSHTRDAIVTTRDDMNYIFRIGNPNLNLHLPLTSWVGGRSNWQLYTCWWFQPLWKILVKMGIFPK